MSKVSWIRLDVDCFKNEKVRALRRRVPMEMGPLLWVNLLAVAGKSNAGGRLMLSQRTPYTVETLADELEVSRQLLAQALQEMIKLDMVCRRGKVYYIRDWENHQSEDKLAMMREKDKLRKREYRARQKEAANSEQEVVE